MMSALDRSKTQVARLWRIDAPLTATAAFMLVALAASMLGLVIDPRLIGGAPAWLKPAKFAASISIYSLTLIWLFTYIPRAERTRRIVGRLSAVVMGVELGIIALQAARGTTSHFNVSTPLNAALFMIMGLAIVTQTLSTVAVAVALFRAQHADHALGWALRLGMLITIAGASLGGLMTQPTDAQLADMRAGNVVVSGAHTVGAPDGGAGIPISGWSREHGDLRIAHFVGLHALQVLPLAALALRRTRASSSQRTRLVKILAGSHAALVGLLLWQALRGQALLSPDASTLAALLAWFTLTGAGAWRALVPTALPQPGAVIAS